VCCVFEKWKTQIIIIKIKEREREKRAKKNTCLCYCYCCNPFMWQHSINERSVTEYWKWEIIITVTEKVQYVTAATAWILQMRHQKEETTLYLYVFLYSHFSLFSYYYFFHTLCFIVLSWYFVSRWVWLNW